MNVEDIKKRLENLNNEVIVLETENKITKEKIEKLESVNQVLLDKAQLSIDAVKFIEEIAFSRRTAIKDKIETIVGEALKNVYGQNYSICFEYKIKGGRSSVDIHLVKKTQKGELRRTINGDGEGAGGGVFDTMALPLKLLVLLATKEADKILFVDEPGKHIDVDRIQKFAAFIKEISTRLEIQIFMCSHHKGILDYADAVFEVGCEDEINSIVSRVK